ncbi:MAG: hypothetical protein KME42_24615 [Tildeniella nuda ZEHNDER 1965/U140]|jgi:hypothetical protein|nr:hypothetical protein [Tildeniella nuda ZEHNDER 1965/U140]
MTQPEITQLTPEQEALIPVYREKWRKIALSTELIDREKAARAVEAAYKFINRPKPKIIFSESPFTAFRVAISIAEGNKNLFGAWQEQIDLASQISKNIFYNLTNLLSEKLINSLGNNIGEEISSHLVNNLTGKIFKNDDQTSLRNRELIERTNLLAGLFKPEVYYRQSSELDFCISALNRYSDRKGWEIILPLIQECAWIFPFSGTAIICDRPRILRFDSETRLHAEGEPAIQFADGYSLYSHHGVTLPEKYGTVHPHQWQSEWLLTEGNAELRRVLIQGIGYARICQELQAIELDDWQEYALLKIDAEADVEPIYLLKMTCPSTGHIHALRVPPAMTTAREAIRWVNWDIDPEAFAVQT